MKLTQLRYLLAVVDHGTVSAAGSALHVAQPAVSRAIRSLEEELGIELFARSGRGMTLTDAGIAVVEQARRAVDEADAVVAVAAALRPSSDALVLATTPSLEDVAAVELVRRWRDELGPVRITARRASDPEDVFELVTSGEADVGLADHPAPPGLVERHLFDAEIVLASPPGSPTTAVTIAELAELPLILPRSGTRRRDEFDALFTAVEFEPVVAVESDDTSSWNAHVLGGLGCAFRYRSQVTRMAPQGMVGRSFDPPIERRVVLVHRPRLAGMARRAVAVLRERDRPDRRA